jgi:hypothetical protein
LCMNGAHFVKCGITQHAEKLWMNELHVWWLWGFQRQLIIIIIIIIIINLYSKWQY